MKNKKTKKIIVFIISAILILIALNVDFFANYMWFKSTGYVGVFLKKYVVQGLMFILSFVFFCALFNFIGKDIYNKIKSVTKENLNKKNLELTRMLNILVSLVLSLYLSVVFSGKWSSLLMFINSKDFGIDDPIFNNDISFYFFDYVFIYEMLYFIILAIFVTGINIIVNSIFILSKIKLDEIEYETKKSSILYKMFDKQNVNINTTEANNIKEFKNKVYIFNDVNYKYRFLFSLAGIIIGLLVFLSRYHILFSEAGVVYGAGYVDVYVYKFLSTVMGIVIVVLSIIIPIIYTKIKKKHFIIFALIIFVSPLVGLITGGIIQRLVVAPDEIVKEGEYINHNIEFTNYGYDLQDIVVEDYPISENLDSNIIENNSQTIDNIMINHYLTTNEVYNQKQGIRFYYNFYDVDLDRYVVDGDYTQIFISPRELDTMLLNEEAKTFLNTRFKYTHGYGAVMSPVNDVSNEGLPTMYIENIPPVTEYPELQINRPEIYYGEHAGDWVIVNSKVKEFDYPSGNTNVENNYEGTGGVKLNFINKVIYSIYNKSLQLFLSNNVTPDSKILMHRNIIDRVSTIMPYLDYDHDPYIVMEDGRLFWIIDAYVKSDKLPYSKPYSQFNYIRNSVKVVIDAYNGDVNFYVIDEKDPVIQTYMSIFDNAFSSFDEMPKSLKKHIRYPEDLLDIQSEVYSTYHMHDTTVFYNKEDQWSIATEKFASDVIEANASYFIMSLPNHETNQQEFVATIPYTPLGKNNMTSILLVRNDGENYGEIINYRFQKGKNIYGPMQIENKIDADDDISKEITFWNQQGSKVIRGKMMILPINNSLLYIEPLYLKAATNNSLPEVKRIIVAYNEEVVMEKTLSDAIYKLFGELTDDPNSEDNYENNTSSNSSVEELINKAVQAYDSSIDALNNSNWTEYGNYQNELSDLLRQLDNIISTNDENNDTQGNNSTLEDNNTLENGSEQEITNE